MVLVVTMWTFESEKVLEVHKQPFPVALHENSEGGPPIVIVSLDYCKLKAKKGEVIARLIGKKSITRLPWGNDTQPADCIKADVPIVLPASAADDEYYIEFEVVYKLNPLKQADPVLLKSAPFMINHTPVTTPVVQ